MHDVSLRRSAIAAWLGVPTHALRSLRVVARQALEGGVVSPRVERLTVLCQVDAPTGCAERTVDLVAKRATAAETVVASLADRLDVEVFGSVVDAGEDASGRRRHTLCPRRGAGPA